MKKFITYFFIIICSVSCTALQDDGGTAGEGVTCLSLDVSVDGQSAVVTKVDGTDFPSGSSIGIGIYKHEAGIPADFVEFNYGQTNIRATKSGSGWSFDANGDGHTYTNLYITKNKDSSTADLYAYAPFVQDVKSPDSIKYDITATNYDVMWASQNAESTNKELIPGANGGETQIDLDFKHVFALIRVGVKLHHSGSTVNLNRISLYHADEANKTTPIYNKVDFNALNGTFNQKFEGDSLYRSGSNLSSYTDYVYYDFVVVPEELDENWRIKFRVNDIEYGYCDITPDMVEHTDGTKGFKAGYRYNFNFILDNYVRFDSVTIDDEWVTNAKFTDYIMV
ncbi:MAG: hypothetical protein Q4G10_04925 [Bacteroidia bacterium]|nr:hypothetical protein [Bacteroidia bacterium]